MQFCPKYRRHAKDQPTPVALVTFGITRHPVRIAVVESLKGKTGWLHLQQLTIDSFAREEYLLFSGIDATGNSLDQETCEKLFHCLGEAETITDIPEAEPR